MKFVKNFSTKKSPKVPFYFYRVVQPQKFYINILAKERKLNPGAVALVDERYGEKLHENSNEKMISDTGLIGYLHTTEHPFLSNSSR